MSLSTATPHGTFASLRVPALRSFFLRQALSLPGTWMQTIAQGWLVIQLTGSGTVLGTVVAVQFVPVLPLPHAAALTPLRVAPTPAWAVAALVPVDTSGSAFILTCNATIKLASDDAYRGRVMSIWSLCFVGSTPSGSGGRTRCREALRAVGAGSWGRPLPGRGHHGTASALQPPAAA